MADKIEVPEVTPAETYDAINDPKSMINDFWGKHDITSRFVVITLILTWVCWGVAALMGVPMPSEMLSYQYNITLFVISIVLGGVKMVSIVAEAFMKIKK
jgi:hypothetical protein